MLSAQDEAILILAVQRRLLEPSSAARANAVCEHRGEGMAAVLARSIGHERVRSLLEELATGRFQCATRGCESLAFAELARLQRLRCRRCDGPLVRPSTGARPGESALAQSAPHSEHIPAGDPAHPRRLGPYLLLEELARGSMGVVYLARHEDLQGRIALKVLLDPEDDPDILARFTLEAGIAARLEHPGIVRVHDAGQEGGRCYYAMEYCEGATLRERLRSGPLSAREAASMFRELARTVAYAHGQGVLHRDLKPANIIIDERTGSPRITDFGLAQDRSLLRSLTRTGDLLGTPIYMSPEQCAGDRSVDQRADVYALGVMLYESLTGALPYMAADRLRLFELIRVGHARPLSELAPDVPAQLEAICTRAMRADRQRRTPSATALADELDAFLTGEAEAPTPPGVSGRLLAASGGVIVGAILLTVLGFASLSDSTAVSTATPAPTRTGVAAETPTPTPSPSPEAEPSEQPRLPPGMDAELEDLAQSTLRPFHRTPPQHLEERFQEARRQASTLAATYPRDARAVYLEVFDRTMAGASDDLELRRTLLRVTQLEPTLHVDLLCVLVTSLHTLGFQRAANDYVEARFQAAERPPAFSVLTLAHIKIKAAPPVLDLPRSVVLLSEEIGLRDAQYPGTAGDRLLVPNWDLHANLGSVLLAQGQITEAARAYRRGSASTTAGQMSLGFERRAAQIEDGRVEPRTGTRDIGFYMGFTQYAKVHVQLQNHEDRRSGREAGHEAERQAQRLVEMGRIARASLLLVRAGRAFAREGQGRDALRPLRQAAGLDLSGRSPDVRALVHRTLARLLLPASPVPDPKAGPPPDQVAEARVAALKAIAATKDEPELFTRGERADALLLLARCERLQGNSAAARQAWERAAAEEPFDRRELSALKGLLE